MDDLKAINDGFKLYKKEGKFLYVRKDYLERSIQAGQVFFDNDTIAVIQQMKRGGKVGEYRYSRDEWNIHQILSVNKKNTLGPFIFMRRFIEEYVKPGRIFGCVHDSNEQSIKWHEAMGFKDVGKIVWSGGTIPGTIYMYDCSDSIDRFMK
jgi:hypothetical protein